MNVSGDGAKGYKVIRLDSCLDAIHPKAELLEADDITGIVKFKDHINGEVRQITLPAHVMKIIAR